VTPRPWAVAARSRPSGGAGRLLIALVAAAAVMVGASPAAGGVREAPAASASMRSPNWAGYAVHRSGVQFTNARGAWAQPAVSCPSGGSYSSFWLGIDGYLDQYVEQVGTGADCSAPNTPAYYAWYEMYPAARVRIATVIHPGDSLEAEVGTVPGGTELSLRDVTSGRTFSTMRRGSAGPLTSAEWVAEAPSACTGTSCSVLPLANFGTVDFTLCSAVGNGVSGTINASGWSADVITMVRSNGTVLAQPSDVTVDGASFNVTVR
jgi:Peptidase A4 family